MDSMDNERNIKLNLIYTLMVFTLLYIIGLVIRIEIGLAAQLFVVLTGSMLVKFILFNPLILYALIAIAFIAVVLLNRYAPLILIATSNKIFNLLENIVLNFMGKDTISPENTLTYWVIILSLISLFTAIVLFKKKNIFLLLPLYIGTFLYYWYNFIDEAYLMIVIFLFIFLLLIGFNKYSKEGTKVNRLYYPWQNTVIKYSILIVLIAYIMPKGFYTIQWPWLHQNVYNNFPIIQQLRATSSYSRKSGIASLFNFSLTGYQRDNSRLGGPVTLSDKKIMTLKAEKSTYLRGNIKQTYTGSSWDTRPGSTKDYPLGQDFGNPSLKERELYYKETEITITNDSFASTTLFSPYKAVEVNFEDNNTLRVTRDDVLIFPHGVYDEESYTIKIQEPLPYGVLVSLGINQKKDYVDDLWMYLQLPEDKITNKTRSLVKEIIKDKDSDYKKAVAIETYLRNNYKYNLNVKEVPQNKEFVDYFLFEGLEGYCTYYASAMAVMLRLEGIPARYVEGFLAQDSKIDGIYDISHKNAHACVEEFIHPVGLKTFEATPVYPLEDRQENYKINDEDESNNPDGIGPNGVLHSKFTRGHQDVNDDEIYSGEFDPDLLVPSDGTNDKISESTINIFIVLLLLIIPARLLFGLLQFKYQEFKVNKLNNNEKIIYLYNQIVKLNGLQDYPQESGETHYEYANRIAYKFFKYNENGIKEITEIFVKSKYSASHATDEDVLEVKKYKESLEKRLKHFLGLRKYYYSKYVKNKYWKS